MQCAPDPRSPMVSMITSVTWWLPVVTCITRYCKTLCCVRGVWLPQLPGGCLWLPLITSVTRYCMTLCCVHGLWLPQLPGGYLCVFTEVHAYRVSPLISCADIRSFHAVFAFSHILAIMCMYATMSRKYSSYSPICTTVIPMLLTAS